MNIKTLIIFIVVTIGVLAGVGGMLWQFGQASDKPIEDVGGEMKHLKGSGDITIVEFSDFQCPACFSVQDPLRQILQKYEGKVQLVYRHFPLTSIHQHAMIAAQAAEAASIQNKFWEMHDILFVKQGEWSEAGDPKTIFAEYAESLGLDKEKFLTDIESEAVKTAVTGDLIVTTRYRLSGTPTFFVNGVKTEFGQIEIKLAELTK